MPKDHFGRDLEMVFFFAVLGRLLSRSAWGRAFVCTVDDLSRRLIQQAVFKGVLGVVLLPVGQYGLFFALLPVGQYGLFFALLPVGQYGLKLRF